MASQRGLGQDDLADLVQEIRIALWEAGPTVRVPEAWLHQVAHYKAIDIIRERGRRRQRERAAPRSPGQSTAARAELGHLLHVRVAGLPARLRRFYSLRYENGYTQREIAFRCGMVRSAEVDAGFVEATPGGGALQVQALHVQGVTTDPAGYCWKVEATGPGGLQGTPSDVWCYRTGAAAPTISSPADGATGVEYAPTLVTWACPYSPGGYRVAFSEYSQSFGGCLQETSQIVPAGATSLAYTLTGNTTYCVKVTSLRSDGSDGFWDGANFKTKPAPPPPAECKALSSDAATMTWPPNYAPLTGGVIQVTWVEEDPSIAQYQVTVWSHGSGTMQQVWASQALDSADLQYGSSDTRLYTVPASFPGSASTGLLYGVLIWARTDKSCKTWSPVGVVDGLYLNW